MGSREDATGVLPLALTSLVQVNRATCSRAAPKRLLTCPARNFLRARLGATQPGKPVRLDLHTLVGKGNNLRLSKMHVLVEPINLPEAEEWVEMVMEAAYIGA